LWFRSSISFDELFVAFTPLATADAAADDEEEDDDEEDDEVGGSGTTLVSFLLPSEDAQLPISPFLVTPSSN